MADKGELIAITIGPPGYGGGGLQVKKSNHSKSAIPEIITILAACINAIIL